MEPSHIHWRKLTNSRSRVTIERGDQAPTQGVGQTVSQWQNVVQMQSESNATVAFLALIYGGGYYSIGIPGSVWVEKR